MQGQRPLIENFLAVPRESTVGQAGSQQKYLLSSIFKKLSQDAFQYCSSTVLVHLITTTT
jgi:hypothetical protein